MTTEPPTAWWSCSRRFEIQTQNRLGALPSLFDFHGGDEGIRTLGPHVANVMLSQLSYIPTGCRAEAQSSILHLLQMFVKR